MNEGIKETYKRLNILLFPTTVDDEEHCAKNKNKKQKIKREREKPSIGH